MALLTVQVLTAAGIEPTYATAAPGGDTFANNGRVFVHVVNGGVGSVDVTVDSVSACNQGFDHDLTVSVPAAEDRMIGPLSTQRFNSSAGQVALSYTGVDTVTIAALQFP